MVLKNVLIYNFIDLYEWENVRLLNKNWGIQEQNNITYLISDLHGVKVIKDRINNIVILKQVDYGKPDDFKRVIDNATYEIKNNVIYSSVLHVKNLTLFKSKKP